MSYEPFDWNVRVNGAWNLAILTPAWIAKETFQVPENTPIQVEVPLNVRAPWRIRYDNIAVLVAGGSLEVMAEQYNYATLEGARQCAQRAMEELPRTPVSAAGYNILYRSREVDSEVANVIDCKIDQVLSDATFQIEGRTLHRSLKFREGQINFELRLGPPDGVRLQFNFHKDSADPEVLKRWLTLEISEVETKVRSIVDKLPGVTI